MSETLVQTVPSPLRKRRFFDSNIIALIVLVVLAFPLPLLLDQGQEAVAQRHYLRPKAPDHQHPRRLRLGRGLLLLRPVARAGLGPSN